MRLRPSPASWHGQAPGRRPSFIIVQQRRRRWRFQTVRVQWNGTDVDMVTVGAVAGALGRCVATVQRLEAAGILPPAPVMLEKRNGQPVRLYHRRYVEALAALPEVAGLGTRRLRPIEPALAAAARAARDAAGGHCLR